MTTFKILVNSTLSTPGAKWLGLDVKNCSSTSIKSNRKSSTIIIYTTLYTKAKSTWKFAAVCMVSPRQESSPKNNLSISLENTAIPLFPTPLDFGAINGDRSHSASSSTSLASNTLAENMLTTSSNASATITKK